VTRGIILAGGTGSRLWPTTQATSKQLLPVYDKPMIYYPLSTVMLSGAREVMIISTPDDLPRFRQLLGDGSHLNMEITYASQPEPRGIAEAFLIAEDFLGDSSSVLVLGDNLFFGNGLAGILQRTAGRTTGATVFAYHVKDPERYGVIEFAADGRVLSIEEKPSKPRSAYALVGMYFVDNTAARRVRDLAPSGRGELEITDLQQSYLRDGELRVEVLGRGMAWLDTGTHDALLSASNFVAVVEERQGMKIGSPEETAYRLGYIDAGQLARIAEPLRASGYGQYLLDILEEGPAPARSTADAIPESGA